MMTHLRQRPIGIVCRERSRVRNDGHHIRGATVPIDLKTDLDLLNRLQSAARRSPTKQELDAQRVSFVYGNMPKESSMTRHQVEEALARFEGAAA